MASQPHIVIIGGAYAGLATLNSLISLSKGQGHDEGRARHGPPGGRGAHSHGPPGGRGGHGPPGGRGGGGPGFGRGGRGGGGPMGRGGGGGGPPGPPGDSRALRVKPRYTLLDERDGFYHSVGAPLGQISPSHARDFWVKYDEIASEKYTKEGVDIVRGSASELDTASKTLTYRPANQSEERSLKYDFLVVASGISRGWPIVPKSLDFSTYVADVERFENELKPCSRIAVIGGGACGIELSAELKVHFPDKQITLIHGRSDLLSREPLSDEFKAIALMLLKEQGVDVKLSTRLVDEAKDGATTSLKLSTGETLECDKVIYSAVQQGPNTEFVPKFVLDGEGYVEVRDTFQFPSNVPNADAHYAVGDVAKWTGIKRSGPAMSQGKFAATNIIASLVALEDGSTIQEAKLASCPPSAPVMTLAIGEQAIGMRMGLRYGREVKNGAFGTGLGIDGTLANLGLRPRKPQEADQAQGAVEDVKLVDGQAVPAATASF